jgi:non-heme chloroperoxidase
MSGRAPRVILSDGIELAFSDRGQGPVVILLHGWGTSRMVWDGQAVDLADTHRMVTYDARGCGESSHPSVGHTIAQAALDALGLADALGFERFSLVGSSLGGNVALETALLAPGRVEQLVLVDAPLHWFVDGVDRDVFQKWLARLEADRIGTIESMVPGWFGPKAARSLEQWTIDLLNRSSSFVDALIRDAGHHDRRAQLASLDVPVTLFHGVHDREVPLSVAQATVAQLHQGQLITFADTGHMPHLEDRKSFSAELYIALRRAGAIC